MIRVSAHRHQATPAALLVAGLLGFASPALAGVLPGSTFNVDIAGFNSAVTVGYLLTDDLQASFGTTQTFAGAGFNGQDITVSSSEVVGATTTSDTFDISTPTDFLTTAKVEDTTIAVLQFDLGDVNSGGSGAPLSSAVPSATIAGFGHYGGTRSIALTPEIYSPGGLFLSASEGVSSGKSAISGYDFNEFQMVFTYDNPEATVPEPSAIAVFAAGLLGLVTVYGRRSRRAGRGPIA